uniref:Uncharacterized protein n=2 Tax=Melopsittacus undulatus TaxID=13146 RepID=A0A8V5FZH5_MELUD
MEPPQTQAALSHRDGTGGEGSTAQSVPGRPQSLPEGTVQGSGRPWPVPLRADVKGNSFTVPKTSAIPMEPSLRGLVTSAAPPPPATLRLRTLPAVAAVGAGWVLCACAAPQPLPTGSFKRRTEVVMEPEPSRIPVCRARHRAAPHQETQIAVPSKKQRVNERTDLEFNKCPDFNFSSNIPADEVFKATGQGLPKSAKKGEPPLKPATVRPLNRYKLEAELKTKNQVLETVKQQLQSKLTEAERIIKGLKDEKEGLVQEAEKFKKLQETCMVILESRNIDPVTGSTILEEEGKTRECQRQTVQFTEELIQQLRLFNQMAAKQNEELQLLTAQWKAVEQERQCSLEQRLSFQELMKECSLALDELELRLAM